MKCPFLAHFVRSAHVPIRPQPDVKAALRGDTRLILDDPRIGLRLGCRHHLRRRFLVLVDPLHLRINILDVEIVLDVADPRLVREHAGVTRQRRR
jgi:hypothetical protein